MRRGILSNVTIQKAAEQYLARLTAEETRQIANTGAILENDGVFLREEYGATGAQQIACRIIRILNEIRRS